MSNSFSKKKPTKLKNQNKVVGKIKDTVEYSVPSGLFPWEREIVVHNTNKQ